MCHSFKLHKNLASTKNHLVCFMAATDLGKWLASRPSMQELEQRNIVPMNYFIDPLAASNGQNLVREMISEQLEEFHENQLTLMDLYERNIRVQFDDFKEDLLISGFVRELFDRDPVALNHTPQDIYNLVQQYYIEMKKWERENRRNDQSSNVLSHQLDALRRRPTITDMGDMHIIPHDYLDNLLEEAVAQHQSRASRMQHVQQRLQRHLPEPVAQTLAETLVTSVHDAEDDDDDGDDGNDGGNDGDNDGGNDGQNDDEWQISFVYPDQQQPTNPDQQQLETWGFVPPQYFESPQDQLEFKPDSFVAKDYEEMTTSTVLSGDDAQCTFKHTDLPLFAMPQSIQIFGGVLVSGFIDELFDFDPNQLSRTPKEIYLLVHRYHMMMAPLLDEGNPKESFHRNFEWRFHDEADLSMFRDCHKDDVLKSAPFMMNDCVFHLELSPNGRGSVLKEGQCALWLTVDSLPSKIRGVAVSLSIEGSINNSMFAERGKEKGILHEPGSSEPFSFGVEFASFDSAEKWTFSITVKLVAMQHEDGTMVHDDDQ